MKTIQKKFEVEIGFAQLYFQRFELSHNMMYNFKNPFGLYWY
jgi:hypothetical protein